MIQVGESQSATGQPNKLQAAAGPDSPSTIPLVEGRLAADIPCLTCGYNLRSLAPDNQCPECGSPVDASLRGNYLRFANPDWVATLASGMNWIVASVVISMAPYFLLWAIVRFTPAQSIRSIQAIFLLPQTLSLVGHWKLTTSDPSQTEPADSILTLCIRIAVAAAMLLDLLYYVASSSAGLDWLRAIRFLCFLTDVATHVPAMLLAGRLAKRIPSPSLVTQFTWLLRGYVIWAVGSIAYSVTILILDSSPSSLGLVIPFATALSIAYLLLGLWMLLVFYRFRRAMNKVAREARQSFDAWVRSVPG